MPQVGIAGNIQAVYGSQVWANWFALGPSARNLKTWWDFNDFNSGLVDLNGPWYRLVSGAGASVAASTPTQLRPGQIVGSTGTTAAGYAGILTLTTAFMFGGGEYTYEADIYVPTLSTAIEEFSIYAGFGDNGGGDQIDGAYFRYDRAILGVNWFACTANNSVRTATDSGVAVGAAAWIRLKVVVNTAGTSVAFYIDDILVATNVANIPTARSTGAVQTIVKSVGITARTLIMDWSWLHYDLTTTR